MDLILTPFYRSWSPGPLIARFADDYRHGDRILWHFHTESGFLTQATVIVWARVWSAYSINMQI